MTTIAQQIAAKAQESMKATAGYTQLPPNSVVVFVLNSCDHCQDLARQTGLPAVTKDGRPIVYMDYGGTGKAYYEANLGGMLTSFPALLAVDGSGRVSGLIAQREENDISALVQVVGVGAANARAAAKAAGAPAADAGCKVTPGGLQNMPAGPNGDCAPAATPPGRARVVLPSGRHTP